jgi:hypothetical protein
MLEHLKVSFETEYTVENTALISQRHLHSFKKGTAGCRLLMKES